MTWDGTVKAPGTIDELIAYMEQLKTYYGFDGTEKVRLILVEGPAHYAREDNNDPRNDIPFQEIPEVRMDRAFPETGPHAGDMTLTIGIPFRIKWETEKLD